MEGVHPSAEEEKITDILKRKVEGGYVFNLAVHLAAAYFIKSLQFLSFNQNIHICKEALATFKRKHV